MNGVLPEPQLQVKNWCCALTQCNIKL